MENTRSLLILESNLKVTYLNGGVKVLSLWGSLPSCLLQLNPARSAAHTGGRLQPHFAENWSPSSGRVCHGINSCDHHPFQQGHYRNTFHIANGFQSNLSWLPLESSLPLPHFPLHNSEESTEKTLYERKIVERT